MKKNKPILTIFIIVLLLTGIILITLTKINNHYESIIHLTKEEKMEDYEYLWTVLNNSYPFWDESGVVKNTVYEEYKKEIQKSNTDIKFMKKIESFLEEFKGNGHLSVLDGFMYGSYDETFNIAQRNLSNKEIKRMKPWYDVLYNSTSKETYSLLDKTHRGFRSIKGLKEEYREQNSSNESIEKKQNLEFNIIEKGKIAYIKIDSFAFENIETDRKKLEKFFEVVAEYPHLVIDLQDNTGGSDKYWEELIVSPNLLQTQDSKRYFLLKQSETTNPFLKIRFKEDEIHSIESLPKLERLYNENLANFSHYVLEKKVVYPTFNEPKFKGKIWILTSPKIYSASENFVILCNNTGFATLVGRVTGGDGGVADPILLSLPNSGLIIRFSMFYGLNNDGASNEANGTKPNILIKEDENALDVTIDQINKEN